MADTVAAATNSQGPSSSSLPIRSRARDDPVLGPTPAPASSTTATISAVKGEKADTTKSSPPYKEPTYSKICEVCEHINFQAIFTPREYDQKTGTTKAIYRPEFNGNGKHPIADWNERRARRAAEKSGPINLGLPKIRVSDFDVSFCDDESDRDLESDSDVDGETKGRNTGDDVGSVGSAARSGPQVTPVDVNRVDRGHDGGEDELPADVQQRFAADLDAIEDDDDDNDDEDDNDNDSAEDEGNYDSEEDIGSVSTWSGDSHFTENERIDLNKQAAGNWSYFHGQLYYLGSIWDVRSRRRRCELCDAFWTKMAVNPDVQERFLTKSRCVLKLLELKGRRADASKRDVTMLNMVFIYSYKLEDPYQSPWVVRNPLVLNGTRHETAELDTSLALAGKPFIRDDVYGEGRWRADECDVNLFRRWLDICRNKHDHPQPAVDNKVKMRLIDVQLMCLVERHVPASELPEYVALSYVWGESRRPRITLTRDTLRLATDPSYFVKRPLNKTIANAITLVEKMDLRYLWVDSLCIVQDDEDDKREQVPQMHEIYRRATFTIVAAFGQNVDAGLPGIAKRAGNWFSLNVKGMRVQFRGSCKMYTAATRLDIGFTENYIRGCPYLSRAWTFQEGLLSPRLLIFTTSMVYWECERCTWCEDAHWESDVIDFVGLRAIKNSTPTDVWNDRFERRAYDVVAGEEEKVEDSNPKSYPAVIKEYTGRNLTWDGDILYACKGVLASMKEDEQYSFFSGLRMNHFGNDLLFNPLKALPLRFPNQTSIESGFPTWSWTAWKGEIEIANEARNNSFDLVENLVPCDGVRCFVLQLDKSNQYSVRVLNQDGGWRFAPDYVREGEGIYDLPDYSRPADSAAQVKDQIDAHDSSEIPTFNQEISVSELQSHPAFSNIKPDFHIIFNTFSTLVVVRLEYDEVNIRMASVVTGGTKMTRTNGIWGNRDTIQRKVFACRKISSVTTAASHPRLYQDDDDHSNCTCCGADTTPKALPEGYELGPYLGRLPALSSCWDAREYLQVVPDGLYKMLWMNNNQLPMFGHLLCKPMSEKAPQDGQWDGEILQRVCGVVGPTEILTRERQIHYCAEWGTHILG